MRHKIHVEIEYESTFIDNDLDKHFLSLILRNGMEKHRNSDHASPENCHWTGYVAVNRLATVGDDNGW